MDKFLFAKVDYVLSKVECCSTIPRLGPWPLAVGPRSGWVPTSYETVKHE